jgi:conjugative transposon TraM protein
MYMQTDKQRKRKGLIIVSLFILAVAFASAWIILRQIPGSGDEKIDPRQGFNTKLPDANQKESGRNKLEIYMQAEKDSVKLRDLQQKDASGKIWFDPTPPQSSDEVFADEYPPKNSTAQHFPVTKKYTDPNERKVNERLEKLYTAINANGNAQSIEPGKQTTSDINKYDNNIAQLEALLQQVQQPSGDTNPEMKQIESVLEKVLDIQHPERVNNRLTSSVSPQAGATYIVTTSQNTAYEDSLIQKQGGNSFFGLQSETDLLQSEDITTILAVVHQDQLLQDASVIKLRLLQDVFIKGTRIPAGTFLFGECSLSDQRLEIRFNSLAYNNIIYPVQLTAFDTDGNEGIYIPGAVGRDEAKNGFDRAVQQMQLATLNPSIGAQAASAGIQAAQSFLSKKVKKVRVTVKAGHRVLLKARQSN